MTLVHEVEVPRLPVSRLEPVFGAPRYAELARAADQARQVLAGRTIWNVNSTVAGGGVAEMLQVLVGYVQDLGIPIGWLVITGDAEFFAITKRLHNQIHGSLSGAPLGAAEAAHYAQMLAANAVELAARVRPGDVVLLHDPQTAGLAAPLAQAGARVVWRCHIGVDWEDDVTRAGWDFLRPHLAAAEAFVFSRLELRSIVDPRREGVDHPAVDRPVLSEEPAARGRHRAGHLGEAGRFGWSGADGARLVRAPRRRRGHRSPGQRPSSARVVPDPMTRCWSRFPAGTGSRTWWGHARLRRPCRARR